MNTEIIRRYGESRLPRYTSYPTAPRFSPSIGAGTYRDWLANIPKSEPVSLYLHVPFCRSMCWYCGCHTTITERDQPRSSSIGRIITPVEDRNAADAIRTRKVTRATHQARWMRGTV